MSSTVAEAVPGNRERYLDALVAWQRRLLDRPDCVDSDLLGLLGMAAGADHVYLATVARDADGGRSVNYEVEWCGPDGQPRLGDPRLRNVSFGSLLPDTAARLVRGESVVACAENLPEPDRSNLVSWGFASLAVLPIVVGGELAGLLGLASAAARSWAPAEVALLEVAAAALAAACERLRIEHSLRDGEDRARGLIDNLPVGVYRTTPDGRVLLCNTEAVRLTNWPGSGAIVSLPYPREQFCERLECEGAILGLETTWPGRDGTDRVVRENARLVRGPDGSPAYYEGTLEDVTERVRTETALRQSGTLLRLVWEGSGDGMRLTDAAGRVRLVNEAFAQLVGRPRDLIEDRPIAEIYAEARQAEIQHRHQEHFATRTVRAHTEAEVELWDGRRRWFEISNSFLEVTGAEPLLLGVFRDVTERKRVEQALRAGEERYRSLMEQASDAIFVSDPVGRLVEVNSRACDLLGCAREELLGRPAREVFAGSDPSARPLRTGLGSGQTATFERTLREREGGAIAVEVSLRALPDGRQIAIVRDIRARKAGERELRVARYALENAPEAIILLANDGRLLDVNEAACRRLGYSRSELLRLAIWDIDPSMPRERWPSRWERMRRAQRTIFETAHRTRDGRLIPIEVTSGLWNYDGQEYATAFCRDITSRKEAEEALRFFKFTADRTADPVYWLRPDRGFRFTYVNRAACAHFGRSEEELLDLRLSDVDAQLTPAALTHLWEDLAEARSTVLETVHRRADGTLVPVEASANRIEFGGLEYLTGYIRDVSERRRAEAELVAVRQRAAEAEKMRALGQVAGGVAHDFNNVLMAVLGLTEVLLTRPDVPDEAKAYLHSIRAAGQDAHQTVRRLQLFARQREGQAERQAVALNEVVADLPALTRHRWADEAQRRGATIRFVTDLGAGLPVAVNPAEIREVLVNLIFNAVDAMPNGGTLTLATGQREGRAFAAVHDTGTGMDEETRRRCLEPFFTTKGFEGTGIGLAVSWSIVQRHGGEIEVESRPGAGSSFTVWLPAAGPWSVVPGPLSVVEGQGQGTRDGKRILVIDDQPIVAQAVAALLGRLGHRAEIALGGQEGVERFRTGTFDAVITDLGMPDVDGAAVAVAVKAQAAVPVLLLTGWGEDLLAGGDQVAGVDTILAKPLTLQKLKEAVERLFPTV